MIKRIKYDKYKLFEYSLHSELRLVEGTHTHTFIFFAGYNEFASKYIYLFKNFFEKIEDCNIKIIIPYLPTYNKNDPEVKQFKSDQNSVNSWFISDNVDGEVKVKTNTEVHKHVISLITNEIKELGTSEKLIFGAFSQGGLYLLNYVLEVLIIKSCFNVIFKSPIWFYKNSHNDDDKFYMFNSNIFYLFYSRFDKVIPFDTAILSYKSIKENFVGGVYFKYDNGKHHILDFQCLEYLGELITCYLKGGTIIKF